MDPVTVIRQYRRGPATGTPRRCINCGAEFGPDESYVRITRDDDLTVAMHSPSCEASRLEALAMALEGTELL